MIEKISLRIFWTMMLLCAASALILTWGWDVIPGELVPTFFILGLASFLIWAPLMAYNFLAKAGYQA
jgi:hypothetical protein